MPQEDVAATLRDRKRRQRMMTEGLLASLKNVIYQITETRGGPLALAAEDVDVERRTGRNMGRRRHTTDIDATLRGAIRLMKTFLLEDEFKRCSKRLGPGSMDMPVPSLLAGDASRRSILNSSTSASILVKAHDLLVVESSVAMADYMPWQLLRGYVGQSLWYMTFKLDLHVLRDFQLSMKAGVTVLGSHLKLRLKRVGNDANSANLVSKYLWQNITVAGISHDGAYVLLMFEPLSEDLLPLSTSEDYWDNFEKTGAFICQPGPFFLPNLEAPNMNKIAQHHGSTDDRLHPSMVEKYLRFAYKWMVICPDVPTLAQRITYLQLEFSNALDRFCSRETRFALEVTSGYPVVQSFLDTKFVQIWQAGMEDRKVHFCVVLSTRPCQGFPRIMQPISSITFQDGNGLDSKAGDPLVHFLRLPDDAVPATYAPGFSAFQFDRSSGRVIHVGTMENSTREATSRPACYLVHVDRRCSIDTVWPGLAYSRFEILPTPNFWSQEEADFHEAIGLASVFEGHEFLSLIPSDVG